MANKSLHGFSGFIVGPERSGTTLTTAFLSQHPDVYVINDPHYLNFFAGSLIDSGQINSVSAYSTCLQFKDRLQYPSVRSRLV